MKMKKMLTIDAVMTTEMRTDAASKKKMHHLKTDAAANKAAKQIRAEDYFCSWGLFNILCPCHCGASGLALAHSLS